MRTLSAIFEEDGRQIAAAVENSIDGYHVARDVKRNRNATFETHHSQPWPEVVAALAALRKVA